MFDYYTFEMRHPPENKVTPKISQNTVEVHVPNSILAFVTEQPLTGEDWKFSSTDLQSCIALCGTCSFLSLHVL